jgi:hypothetical protein
LPLAERLLRLLRFRATPVFFDDDGDGCRSAGQNGGSGWATGSVNLAAGPFGIIFMMFSNAVKDNPVIYPFLLKVATNA